MLQRQAGRTVASLCHHKSTVAPATASAVANSAIAVCSCRIPSSSYSTSTRSGSDTIGSGSNRNKKEIIIQASTMVGHGIRFKSTIPSLHKKAVRALLNNGAKDQLNHFKEKYENQKIETDSNNKNNNDAKGNQSLEVKSMDEIENSLPHTPPVSMKAETSTQSQESSSSKPAKVATAPEMSRNPLVNSAPPPHPFQMHTHPAPFHDLHEFAPKITVVGVGGAGGNALNNMIAKGLSGVNFLALNTDAQHLATTLTDQRLQLGLQATYGLGCGANPEMGKAAAEESKQAIKEHFEGSHLAFITAGMGGGTGTGAAPVVADICSELGILTVGVVTLPFSFEGTHRRKLAIDGIKRMQSICDTLIVIPNQNLFKLAGPKTTFVEAFQMADDVLLGGVRSITDLMTNPGLINLDFADVRAVMVGMGNALLGTGEASTQSDCGEEDDRAIRAAQLALDNPLLGLEWDITTAKGMLVNITGGRDMTLFEVDSAAQLITEKVQDANANIIFGSAFDERLEGSIRVSVVATGIDEQPYEQTPRDPFPTSNTPGAAPPATRRGFFGL